MTTAIYSGLTISGWDRVEGGGRANYGLQYTAQFNRAGSINALFGQSCQLVRTKFFAFGGTTNTGLDSGLDTTRSGLRGAPVVPAKQHLHVHVPLPF